MNWSLWGGGGVGGTYPPVLAKKGRRPLFLVHIKIEKKSDRNSWGSYILEGKVDDFGLRFDLLAWIRYGVHLHDNKKAQSKDFNTFLNGVFKNRTSYGKFTNIELNSFDWFLDKAIVACLG